MRLPHTSREGGWFQRMGNKRKHGGWGGAGGRAGAGLLFCKEHWDGGQAGDGAAELRGEAECTRMAAGGVQGAAGSRGGQDRGRGGSSGGAGLHTHWSPLSRHFLPMIPAPHVCDGSESPRDKRHSHPHTHTHTHSPLPVHIGQRHKQGGLGTEGATRWGRLAQGSAYRTECTGWSDCFLGPPLEHSRRAPQWGGRRSHDRLPW